MSLEQDVRQAIEKQREAANTLIERQGRKDDTVTLSLMLHGLSKGVEDALGLMATRLEALGREH
jgi:hypothetical protein